MKAFLVLMFAAIIFSCNQPYQQYQQQPQYQVITSPNGQQMVQYQDNGQTLLMDYIIWNQLYSQGGYNSIRNYNTTHTVIHYTPSGYSNWKSSNYSPSGSSSSGSSGFRSNSPSTGSKFTPSTPSNSGFRSNTPSAFSSKSSSFKSSSSTSRSSGFRRH